MKLTALTENIPILLKTGVDSPVIHYISTDSRNIRPGTLFFAIDGEHVDGHRFIASAVDSGAVAVIHSQNISKHIPGITYIQVEDTRAALSAISACFFGHPSRQMFIIGVTGTDGKSTTVSLIRQLLEFCKLPAGSLSTVEFCLTPYRDHKNPGIKPNTLRQSTPDPPQIHMLLQTMLENGVRYAVVESTSHGLSPRTKRLADVDFNVALFTNLGTEHLEFHGNMENYRNDKAELFRAIAKSPHRDSFAVVNLEDPQAEFFINASGNKPVITYGLNPSSGSLCHISELSTSPTECRFNLHSPGEIIPCSIPLPGSYNVANTLAALCVVNHITGRSFRELAPALPGLRGVKGRMTPITGDMDFHVIVDYAHSPGSFSQVLPFLRTLAEGRLILVFGSAGERDRTKRPQQGALAEKYADIVILCNEDPRGEDPMAILNDIAKGISSMHPDKQLFKVCERRKAIARAFHMARAGDLVATLGKGHESNIIHSDGPRPWDEEKVCREELCRMGFKVPD